MHDAKARHAERRRRGDDDLRAAFAAAVRNRYPSCPADEESRIARYACSRNRGRVGRVSATHGYFDVAVELAVVAHVRHRFSRYEALLGAGWSREAARAAVWPEVGRILQAWSTAAA